MGLILILVTNMDIDKNKERWQATKINQTFDNMVPHKLGRTFSSRNYQDIVTLRKKFFNKKYF
jgi:hypothetical protein